VQESLGGAAEIRVKPVPAPLRWHGPPGRHAVEDGRLRLDGGPGTDLFADPGGEPPLLTASFLAFVPVGDFALSARVDPALAATFDAGALVLWASDRSWAKLCLELSPHGVPTIVSVVTRGVSDDANAFAVDPRRTWLRVCRIGAAFAFHASDDGTRWSLVRYFALDAGPPAALGFLAQSPTGDGCGVTFDGIRLADPPADSRGGD